jgi:hypothetical protein
MELKNEAYTNNLNNVMGSPCIVYRLIKYYRNTIYGVKGDWLPEIHVFVDALEIYIAWSLCLDLFI